MPVSQRGMGALYLWIELSTSRRAADNSGMTASVFVTLV